MRRYGYTSVIFAVNIFLNLMATSEDFILDSKTQYLSNYKITDVIFFPGDETLSTTDEGVFYLWDIKTKSIIKRTYSEFGAMNNLFVSSDGKYIAASTNDPSAFIIDGKTGELLYRVQHNVPIKPHESWHWLNSISFSPDSKYLLTSYEKTICIWDVMTGKLLQQFDVELVGSASNAKYFKDGKRFILKDYLNQSYSHVIFNIETKKYEKKAFPGDQLSFYSSDMNYIGGRGMDGQTRQSFINIWNINTNELVIKKNIPGYGSSVDMSVDKKFVIIAEEYQGAKRKCWLYDLNKESIVKEDFIDKNSEEYNQPIKVVRFSNDLKYAAVAIEGKLHVYDISSLTAHANEGFTLTK